MIDLDRGEEEMHVIVGGEEIPVGEAVIRGELHAGQDDIPKEHL